MRAWMKSARKAQNLTQEELAKKAKCSRPMITDIENGNATPSIKTAKAVASFLGVHWTAFFTEEPITTHSERSLT